METKRFNWFGCITTFIVLLMLGGVSWWLSNKVTPCQLPIHYSIANADSRFKITSSEVQAVAKEAETRWESALGKDYFQFDPNGNLKINLIYDERQARIDELNRQSELLGVSAQSIESYNSKLQSLVNNYANELNSYNQRVAEWNAKGGAPEDIFNQLEAERKSLDERRNSINQLAGSVNSQIDEHNSNLNNFRNEINAGKNKLITQGLYYPDKNQIDIFTFYNKTELRLVLMHEMGHATGFTDHTASEVSIMYPVLEKQTIDDPKPLAQDISAVLEVCRPVPRWQVLFVEFQQKLLNLRGIESTT